MFKFFKKFKAKPENIQDKFRVRVSHYNAKYYCIEYKFKEKDKWALFRSGIFFTGDPRLSDAMHPYLSLDFNETVKFAKTLTPEIIVKRNKELDDKMAIIEQNWRKEMENYENKFWEN